MQFKTLLWFFDKVPGKKKEGKLSSSPQYENDTSEYSDKTIKKSRRNRKYRVVQSPPEPECTSLTSDVDVPGLFLFEDFLSGYEESELLSKCTFSETALHRSMNRRVQVNCFFLTMSFLCDKSN